jgi:SAM-dependent methyltransferase
LSKQRSFGRPTAGHEAPHNQAMDSAAELVRFYDESYSSDPAEARRYADWRALSAVGKADHVERLCVAGGARPDRVVEVGCGDGALLSELSRRGFAELLDGFEITEAAVTIARQRREIHAIRAYDGERLPVADAQYDVGILSHVLEHVPDPVALLAEVGRTCRAVVVEVPLEANLSARRAGKRQGARRVGHLHRFDRDAVRAVVSGAGLELAAELEDPLPLAVHQFFAADPAGRARGALKWGVRAATAALAPALARRLFTVHYACLCRQPGR